MGAAISDAVNVSAEVFANREADVGWEFLERKYTLQPVTIFGDQASYRLEAGSWAACTIRDIDLLHTIGFITLQRAVTDLMTVIIRRGSLTIRGLASKQPSGRVGVHLGPLVDLQFLDPTSVMECVRTPLSQLSTIAAEQAGIDPHGFWLEVIRPISRPRHESAVVC